MLQGKFSRYIVENGLTLELPQAEYRTPDVPMNRFGAVLAAWRAAATVWPKAHLGVIVTEGLMESMGLREKSEDSAWMGMLEGLSRTR